ncbi:MAG: hypothetical protein ACAH59_05860 [Pseudobdellovibrionaceae bacterium]
MKFFLVLTLFLIVHQAQAEISPEGFIDSPSKCFSQRKYPCSLRVSRRMHSFEREAQRYHLGENGALLFLSESQIQLMQGVLWIQSSKDLEVKSSSALSMKLSGEWLLEKRPDTSLLFRNLKGSIDFQSKFVFTNESLPVGFQNWYGPMDSSGQISRGMIRPLVLKDFLQVWIPLSGLSLAEVKRQTADYKKTWGNTVEQSSKFYQQVAERRLASQEEKARKLAAQKASRQQEQSDFRQMFRKKNGL